MSNHSSHSARTLLADLTAMIQQCHSESGSQPGFRSGLEKLLPELEIQSSVAGQMQELMRAQPL